MNAKQKDVVINLDRDPRYAAAKARLTELKTEFNALERERAAAQDGLSSLASDHGDRIKQEATAMLSGHSAPDAAHQKRAALAKTLDELAHRLAVLREAVAMQRDVVANLRSEVGKAISMDLLPAHRANVSAVAAALLQLNTALEAEADLRETLNDNDVPYSSVIRPMPVGGIGTLRDNQSRIMRYLLECHEYGFLTASELPDVVRDWIPAPTRKEQAVKTATQSNDGWPRA